jgi:hypothetical protein
MKKIYFVILLSMFNSIGWSQSFQWAKRAGLWEYDYGLGIGTDNSGNVYIAGKFEQNANFSGTVVPCQGNHDIYVAKYTPAGALTWVRTAGGSSGDYAHAMSVDYSAVYIAGEIQGSGNLIKFVGSPITLNARGANDIVVAKYDLNGNLLWARVEGDVYNDEGLGVTSDQAGNVYVCGFFTTKARFGASTTLYSAGAEDIFIAKYSSSGSLLWVKKAGGSGKDEAKSIKCDAAGNVYVCGSFKGSASFSGQTVNSHGNTDMFLAKYSTNGDLQWVKAPGGPWDDLAWSVTIDNAGKIFVTGEFNASVMFGGIQLNTTGSTDAFIVRYNSSGSVEWAKKAGGSGIDRARGIGTDGNNIFITGQFSGTAYFGATTRYAADASDVFMAALNNSGNFLWATSVGGPADAQEDLGYESGNAICARTDGSVYATGAILNGGQFGSTTLNAYSRTDIFLTKLRDASGMLEEPNTDAEQRNEMLVFTANKQEDKVRLKWTNPDKGKNEYFLVERRADADSFSIIGKVMKDTINDKDYEFIDTYLPQQNSRLYYRINQTDYDGKAAYSLVDTVIMDVKEELHHVIFDFYPNPASNTFTLYVSELTNPAYVYSLYDMSGKKIKEATITANNTQIEIGDLSAGIYLVGVNSGTKLVFQDRLVVQ